MTTATTNNRMSPPPPFKYDRVLDIVGGCGRWQWLMLTLLSLISAGAGVIVVVWSFVSFDVASHCATPYCANLDHDAYDAEFASLINPSGYNCRYLRPVGLEPQQQQQQPLMTCDAYRSSLAAATDNATSAPAAADFEYATCTASDLRYDTTSVRTSTLVTEFGLACGGGSVVLSFVGASYMVGMLVGSFAMGLLSDKFGRVPALVACILLVSITGAANAYAPSPTVYALLRFMTGIGGVGLFMVAFVLIIEYVDHANKTLAGIAIEIPFAVGEFLLGIEAYYIRDWRWLQLVAHTSMVLLLPLFIVVPESPRWLASRGEVHKALDIADRIGKMNKNIGDVRSRLAKEQHQQHASGADTASVATSVTDDVAASTAKLEMRAMPGDASSGSDTSSVATTTEAPLSIRSLLSPRKAAVTTVFMWIQWFSVTLCYYGLSYASTSLLGDPYTNFLLNVAIEVPGYIFCMVFMDAWGRRPILSFCQVLSGLACVAVSMFTSGGEAVSSLAWLQVTLSLIGKFGASACFAIVYIYTAELYPTAIRNTAIGTCSTVARFGGIAALLIVLLAQVWAPLPVLLMGLIAIVAGLMAFHFPETAGQRLPETQAEALAMGQGANKRSFFSCTWTTNEDDGAAE